MIGDWEWSGCDWVFLWFEWVFVVLFDFYFLVVLDEVMWGDFVDEFFIVSEVVLGQEIYDYLVWELVDFGWYFEIQV